MATTADKPKWIARPGDEAAQTALRKGVDSTTGILFPWATILVTIVCSGFTLPRVAKSEPVVALLLACSLGLVFLGICTVTVIALYQKRIFRQHVAAGNIIRLHPEFIRIWDEFRAEKELRLTDKEYDRFLPELFTAAQNTTGAVQSWIQYDKSEMGDSALWAKAIIRVHLRPALERIRRHLLLEAQGRAKLSSVFKPDDASIIMEFELLKTQLRAGSEQEKG